MFKNREHAGKMLVEKLMPTQYKEIVILALPRGGVVVAKPIAEYYKAKIKLLIIRKIGHPYNPEVAIGAMMPDASTIIDKNAIARWNIQESVIQDIMKREYYELKKRTEKYHNIVTPEDVKGKTVLIIDDGVATGYSATAAINWLKKFMPPKIILCTPVIAADVLENIRKIVDDVIYIYAPHDFMAVGAFYQDFAQVEDQEVIEILKNN